VPACIGDYPVLPSYARRISKAARGHYMGGVFDSSCRWFMARKPCRALAHDDAVRNAKKACHGFPLSPCLPPRSGRVTPVSACLGTSACMGRILSRGCRKGPNHLLVRQFLCSPSVSLFDLAAVSSPRPTHPHSPARAEAVRDGRVSAHRRLVLEGFEH